MNETFRLRKKVKSQGMAYSAIFLAIVIAYCSLFFLENPADHGIKGEHSLAFVGGMGITVFGTMLFLSIYTWAAYYVERFSISGSTLTVRSMLQNRQFDVSELVKLKWGVFPAGGSIKFFVLGSKARLDLYGYEKEDRLKIIHAMQEMVPPDIQDGWSMFCHKIALPLRDGKPPKQFVDPQAKYFTITRKRYDRTFMFAFPLSVCAALALGFQFQKWEFAMLPLLVTGAWLLLRLSIPKEGRAVATMYSTQTGRGQLIGLVAIVGGQLIMFGLSFLGIQYSVIIACVFMLVMFPPMLRLLLKGENQEKRRVEQEADSAPLRWLQADSVIEKDANDKSV